MSKHKDKILYTLIFVLIVTILFMQNIIYIRTIDNAIIMGITKKEIAQVDPYANEIVDETIARTDRVLADTDILLADARKRGWLD